MHSLQSLALATTLLGLTTCTLALPRPDVPDPGAPFLRSAAPDITRLVQAVQKDPAACGRYARIFHVPAAQVPFYLQRNYVPGTLPRTDIYTVSLVSRRGTVYPVWMTLPAGTPVFASRHGVLMLLRDTGDPVTPLTGAHAPAATPGAQVIVPNEPQIVPVPTTPISSP